MEAALLTFVAACWALLGTSAITGLVSLVGHRSGDAGIAGARRRDLDRAWESYAWSKRFRFRPAIGDWPRARAPRIQGRVGDLDLVIEAVTMRIRGSPRACTRIWARPAVPTPARVVVASETRLVQGPRVHDLDVVRLGDPCFDSALSVRASTAEEARRFLRPDLRRALQGLLSASYRLALVLQKTGNGAGNGSDGDDEVSLTWLGEETRPAMLNEACAVVVRACETEAGDAYR